jgi:hypothetical protein
MNTGQLYEEQQRLEYLKKKGVNFLEDDVGKTISYIQIPTNFSDQDLDSLVKLVAPVDGEVKFRDGVAWIWLRRHHAYPLWQKGLFFILYGLSFYYTLYYLEDLFLNFYLLLAFVLE